MGMKIVIFGASGASGLPLTEQALGAGHTVTAFVRTPAKLTLSSPNLNIVQGDVTDDGAVAKAVAGQDAALSALGAKTLQRAPELTEGIRHIVTALEAEGVRRFVYESSLGTGDSADKMSFSFRYFVAPFILKNALADHEEKEGIIRASSLDWVIVRPGQLVNGERTGVYQTGIGFDNRLKSRISRADVADFMLKSLVEDVYLQKAPYISY